MILAGTNMKKNDPKKDPAKPKPPAPPPPPIQQPPPIPPILVSPPTVRRGSGSQVLPDLQSMVSGFSRMSGSSSMNSQMSGGDNPQDNDRPNEHRHHHHHIPHPNLDGFDMFKRRDRSGRPPRDGQITPHGPARVAAPKLLVITMESGDKVEAHGGNELRRRLAGSDTDDLAFQIISTQIHDIGDLEWMLDEESKILFRKHVIYWKSALSMPRRKMEKKDTQIPLAGTLDFYKPLTRCQRYNRACGRTCCSKYRMTVTEDLLREESLRTFKSKIYIPGGQTDKARTQIRREHIFDPQAPAYTSYMSKNDEAPPEPK